MLIRAVWDLEAMAGPEFHGAAKSSLGRSATGFQGDPRPLWSRSPCPSRLRCLPLFSLLISSAKSWHRYSPSPASYPPPLSQKPCCLSAVWQVSPSLPQFLHLWNGHNLSTHLPRWLWGLSELICVKPLEQCLTHNIQNCFHHCHHHNFISRVGRC